MDINPEEVISNLSSQIGTLMTENLMLKMAVGKMQEELDTLRSLPIVPAKDKPAKK
jgi:regulator of replication initiation timing